MFSDKLNLDIMLEYNDNDFNNDLVVFNEIIEYAKANNIHTVDDLYDIDENIYYVFDYLNERVANTNVMGINMKDLSNVLDLFERLISTFNQYDDLLSFITSKMTILYKMRKNDLAEECMLEYIRNNPDDGNAYLELMFALDAIAHDRDSATYYGNLALERENISERNSIIEFIEDLE